MITLSFSSDKGAKNANRGTHEQQIRDTVDTHLAFPGSEKLKMGVNIKNNGAAGSLKETAPNGYAAQVIGFELRMGVIRIDGVRDRGGRGEAGNSRQSAKDGVVHCFQMQRAGQT